MNKKELFQLLQKYTSHPMPRSTVGEVDDIDWKLERGGPKTAVFYNLKNDINAKKVFEERLEGASFAVVFIPDQSGPIDRDDVILVPSKNWLPLQELLSNLFFDPIPSSLKIIGVTGTNGKTSTVNFCMQTANALGIPAVAIGTLGVQSNETKLPSEGMTTPPYIEIRRILSQFKNKKVAFFEVSSHALDQDRFYNIKFHCCSWTSFSRDHLDYHKSEHAYFNAKKKVLSQLRENGVCFIPERHKALIDKIDDPRVVPVPTVSLERDFLEQKTFLKAIYNRENLSLALKMLEVLGNEKLVEKINLNFLNPVEGRFNSYKSALGDVIIDFAHTPDALENILKEVRESFTGRKITVVFGCGGDRDRGKRPLMGRVAEQFSDKVIVTSDNPRFEDPLSIIEDICQGIKHKTPSIEVDRKMAIVKAWKEMKKGEIIIIAGKGHENYIDTKGIKSPYSDAEVVLELLRGE